LRRSANAPPGEAPLVLFGQEGPRLVVTAADAPARALGLRPGMALAEAQALVPDFAVAPADPAGEAAGLARLAAWCLRYAPLAAPDPPDGLWIDIAGAAHLAGGEAALLDDLRRRLGAMGLAARVAVAETPGAAWALARFGADPAAVVPLGGVMAALAPLPPAALRLGPEAVALLGRLGIARIDALAALPRGPLARRCGAAVPARLDQALGRAPEPIVPVLPPAAPAARADFPEPLLDAAPLGAAIEALAAQVCARMEAGGVGARRLDLRFERLDGTAAAIRIGTARASRAPAHLARLLRERLETIDPGLGVAALALVVTRAEPLGAEQAAALGAGADTPDLADLVDRLANRLGTGRVWQAAPVESTVPERAVRRMAPLASGGGRGWPGGLPRPARLLSPPQPIEALALLPDHPPAAFTWRHRRFRVRRADGPERIWGEWWRRDAEVPAARDYWRVEDEAGRRFWLYRRGDGVAAESGDLRWFLHGVW
jgi:protein ImuB